MAVEKQKFGSMEDGREVFLYTLTNRNGLSVQVMDFGANLVSVKAPDRNGKAEDLVLGFDDFEGYTANLSFFGAAVGPNANRIANARVQIDGVEYRLDVNDGPNNLHTHLEKAYHKRLWHACVMENGVRFTLQDADGSLGLPGNREVSLSYFLTDTNRLELHYHMESDKKTVFNMTNHSYFNLKGAGNGKIEDHILWLNASAYTPVVKGAIPTGELALVEGTPMDFRTPKVIGQEIGKEFEQLKLTGGYDHNWIIDDYDGSLKLCARVKSDVTGRTMKVYTNLPGIQFYAGNFIDTQTGKGGAEYGKRSGLCLETQFFPDAPNQKNFPSSVFGPDRIYDYTTIFEFSVE